MDPATGLTSQRVGEVMQWVPTGDRFVLAVILQFTAGWPEGLSISGQLSVATLARGAASLAGGCDGLVHCPNRVPPDLSIGRIGPTQHAVSFPAISARGLPPF